MGTNTGNGGFDVDGKTYTFDPVDPTVPDDTVPPKTDHGDVRVDNTKKDIGKTTKETLAKYLSDHTKQNAYPTDPTFVDETLNKPNGLPNAPAQTPNSNFYVNRDEIKQTFDLPQQLRSGKRLFEKPQDPQPQLAVDKGKQQVGVDQNDGNHVLRAVTGGNPGTLPPAISPYVSTTLSNNRFTAASQAVSDNISSPANTYNPVFSHPRYGSVSSHRLAQVGVALSIRSSQELLAANAGNNPSAGSQEARSLLPGFNQLGASRVSTTVLEARDVLETLTNVEIEAGTLTSTSPGGSWGSLNNVEDQFSGITAIGMIALSVALTAAIVVLFEGLGFLIGMIKGGQGTAATFNKDHKYALGRYTLDQAPNPAAFPPTSFPPDIGALIGIRPTLHPFSTALQAGVAAFFGIDTSGGLFGAITSGLTSSTQNPGFNAIVARTIIRSSLTIIDSFKNAFSSPNLVAGIKNVLSIIEIIRASKLISAMNVFANLGDAALFDDLANETVDSDIPGDAVKKSRIDKLHDDANAVSKNRLNNSLKLAWSSNRSPASYLVPDGLMTFAASGKFGAFLPGFFSSPQARNYFKLQTIAEQLRNGPRIPYDSDDDATPSVKKMEGLLEAEYMPFYLHDLRTNEIISFHAFITQLTDDFKPNWETTEAYGRVDPVKVYKSTNRSINIGFYIVSTSKEDFDDMWFKINKLVTLVYPQYTQGRLLSDQTGDNQFVQPFSQLIGASPLVRLRLGDLFRSNYSRFALARLFGADSNLMKLDGTNLDGFKNARDGYVKLKQEFNNELANPTGEYLITINNLPKSSDAGISIPVSLPAGASTGDKPSNAGTFNVDAGDLHFFKFQVKKQLKNDQVQVAPLFLSPQELQDWFGMSKDAITRIMNHLSARYDNKDAPVNRVIGGEYVAPKSALRLTPTTTDKLLRGAFGTAIEIDKLTDFLSVDNNALVKSFQDNGGKGLAGTIESLNFDYYDRVTWEIEPGSRAPKFCRVTMTFTPIHDISPGLDVNGYNRAPVYPVGRMAHGADNIKGK